MEIISDSESNLLPVKRRFIILIFQLAVLTACPSFSQNNIIVHDPVMIKQDNRFYLFCTGFGISVWSSEDMVNWEPETQVFVKAPDWAVKEIPGFRNHIWAPDISFHNGKYYLFYSVSAFGKNTSCIGLAINITLNDEDPLYKWDDQGKVIQSVPGRDLWNAIDPNLILDDSDQPWLVFGSFWNGMKLVKMKKNLTAIAEPQEWFTVAKRYRDFKTNDLDPGEGSIEAPFIFKKNDYYYLFTSFDFCCRGVNSNYKIMVGRSAGLTGPYLDKNGIPLIEGGGSPVLEGNVDFPGVGHNSAYTFDGKDYLVFHGYDAKDEGKPKLMIKEIEWDSSGWPSVTWIKKDD